MYGVFLNGCLRQRWSQGCLHFWARWILTPPPLSTLHALCLLQYWFSTPSLIPSPYNIRFSKPGVTVSGCFWNLPCAVVLWLGKVWEKHSGIFFFLPHQPVQLSFETGFSRPTKVWTTTQHWSQLLDVVRENTSRSSSLSGARDFLFTKWTRSINF